MKPIFSVLFFHLILFFACRGDQPSNQKPTAGLSGDTTTSLKPIPIFWKTICEDNHFSKLFDCNTSDCYQIELLNDPFKDLVVLSISIQDSLIDEIFYYRFSFKTHKITNKSINFIPVVNTMTKDTLFCYYTDGKRIKMEKNYNMNIFFTKSIWLMSPNDENISELDGETWKIRARSGNREMVLSRHLFKDSIYYSNIQNILDICKIKDYKYKYKKR